MKNTISFVGCFTIVWNMYGDGTGDEVKVVLVKRKDKPVWELPGGALDPKDIVECQDCFANCAIRELLEEAGMNLEPDQLKSEAILVQSVPIGNNDIALGTVHLYSYRERNISSFLRKLESFTGDETEQVLFTLIDEAFFEREDVSRATKRMIAILLKWFYSREEHHDRRGALRTPVYLPWLGSAV